MLWTPAEEEERVGVDGELLRRMQDGTTQTDRKRHRRLIKGVFEIRRGTTAEEAAGERYLNSGLE